MNKIRCLIVDDESLARERLRGFLSREPDLEILGECIDGPSALATLEAQNVDALFIDIEMPGLNGVQVASSLANPSRLALVFVTAHDEYAIEAFGVRAVDYLLKPFDRERLNQTLARVREHHRLREAAAMNQKLATLLEEKEAPKPAAPQRIAVKTDGRIVFVKPEELLWAEAADNYVILHVADGRLMLRETMSGLESRLNSTRFTRVNRSAIVNLDHVRELQPAIHGDYVVVLKNGTKLPLSRSLRGQLERFIR